MDGWEGEGLNKKEWKRARSGGSRELSLTTADVHAIPVPPSIVPSGRASHSCRARARADTREHESKRTPELFALSKGLRVGEMGGGRGGDCKTDLFGKTRHSSLIDV